MTELAWDDRQSWQDGAITHVPQYTPAPCGPRGFVSETIFIEDTPDHDFLGNSSASGTLPTAESDRLVRWPFLLRYPDTVAKQDGEAWNLGTHAQEAKHMLGLRRYVSWKAQPRPPGIAERAHGRWDRLTELAFADWDAWREGAVTKMPHSTRPPYGNPGFLSETVFIRELPD